ncbi:MAG: hypothetical protein J7647_07610 [Cyanobacteria bacterium SBLK]|nr:hypothetical protein [Cyanobacteria bacterium SBLK]
MTFGLAGSDIEDEKRLVFAKNLLPKLRELDEVEEAGRTEDLAPEVGSKPGLAKVIGMLTVKVNFKNIKSFAEALGDRLKEKPIKGTIKVGENQVDFEVGNPQDLAEFEKTALNLIAAMNRESDGSENSPTDRS